MLFIEKNNYELGCFFYKLDSIKKGSDNSFNIHYHLNENKLSSNGLNENEKIFFKKNDSIIKEFCSKYYVREIKYTPKNQKPISVFFRMTTKFGTVSENLSLQFKIEDNNYIRYYFINERDTINIKTLPLKRQCHFYYK